MQLIHPGLSSTTIGLAGRCCSSLLYLSLTLLYVLAVHACMQVVRREGKSRGFGFVTFREDVSVEKCLLVNHYIKNRKVELKRAVPKVRQTPHSCAMRCISLPYPGSLLTH